MEMHEIRDALKRIKALAENPHWTMDRRWTIADLATKAIAKIDGKDQG